MTDGGETRVFPSGAADHSGEKSRVSSPGKYRKLMIRYLLFSYCEGCQFLSDRNHGNPFFVDIR
ncbi:Uncharacterized protein dnm_090780 [Desulfonema magnum]|uniref:Uncharacterized protein n=1 Tax=Desulfonema magnum TaxID=45655 RepID=A0A975GTC6_9BACT|nr:Uncharacterized protein dnm_090780 [Desulfonema magnum]